MSKDAADRRDESVEDITAAATAPNPMYATGFGQRYFKANGKMLHSGFRDC